jgi:hypothetical protein
LREKLRDRLVVADGAAEIAVQDAFPVAEVLFTKGGVESEGVAGGGDVGGRGAFTEHLLDGIAGDEVDQEEDQAHYQPDDWEGVEDALGYSFQLSVLSSQSAVRVSCIVRMP